MHWLAKIFDAFGDTEATLGVLLDFDLGVAIEIEGLGGLVGNGCRRYLSDCSKVLISLVASALFK